MKQNSTGNEPTGIKLTNLSLYLLVNGTKPG